MKRIHILFSTIDSQESAKTLARQLVEEKLVACVNIIANVFSVYKWKGRLEETPEWLLVMKTAEDRLPLLMERLKELHPYEVPEMIALPIDLVLPAYRDWVVAETRA